MMWQFKTALMPMVLMSVALLSVGCATKLKSVTNGAQINPAKNEGYLLLNVATNTDIYKIRISGRKHFELTKEDLRVGSNYMLLPMAPGDYRLSRDIIETYKGRGYVNLDESLWQFTVRPGSIGYIGHMEVETSFWKTTGKYKMINRSTKALEYLQNIHLQLLKKHGVRYRGPGKDDFFEVVGVSRPQIITNEKGQQQ